MTNSQNRFRCSVGLAGQARERKCSATLETIATRAILAEERNMLLLLTAIIAILVVILFEMGAYRSASLSVLVAFSSALGALIKHWNLKKKERR